MVNNDSNQPRSLNKWPARLIAVVITLWGLLASYLQIQQAGLTLLNGVLVSVLVIALVLQGHLWGKKFLEKRSFQKERARLLYNHLHNIEMLRHLIDQFATYKKAKYLINAQVKDIRVVAILPVEGKVGVLLNIGKEQHLQEGTRLLVFRTDRYTSEAEPIEQLLGLVEVKYVQANSNCSQAIVRMRDDREFWDQKEAQLRQGKRIDLPKNFVIPYIPPELSSLTPENLDTIQAYLKNILNQLILAEQGQNFQEEIRK